MKNSQPLNIALLTDSTKPRGGAVHTLELAEALQKAQQSVTVFALDKDGQGFFRPLSCAYQPVPTAPAPDTMDELIRRRIQDYIGFFEQHLQEHCYDIFHAQDCISANALIYLREQGRIPHMIRTVHHVEDFVSPYLQNCQRSAIHQADRCLCISKHWQERLENHHGIPAALIHNGIIPERFSPIDSLKISAFKQRMGLAGQPIFLMVGGIEPRKNAIALLEAFAKILADYPQAQLVIAGGEILFDYRPYREAFFQRVEDLNITVGESLILSGSVTDEDLNLFYQSADAFVFPSLKEGWGLVILEAIAARLPVVASGIPPFTEFLQPDQAILIDPESVGSIADGMRAVVCADRALALVENSQSILPQYRWDRSAHLHIEHYHRLLNLYKIKERSLLALGFN